MAFNLNTIEKKKPSTDKKKINDLLNTEIHWNKTKFTNKDKEVLYTELGVLLNAGISLKDALELISQGYQKDSLKQILASLVKEIIAGKSFAEAIKLNGSFSEYEYYSIQIGEETGTLYRVIEQLGYFFHRKNEQKRILINAITYPIIIVVTALLAIVFMLHYVVPMFEDIFNQQGIELPKITQWIISISKFIKLYGIWILLFVFLLFFIKRVFKKNIELKNFQDQIIIKLPFIGAYIKTVYMSQFTQALSLLTASKIPLVNSIKLVENMIDFYPLNSALQDVQNELIKGKSLSYSMSQNKFFDQHMIAMVKVAEESNQTSNIFKKLNVRYADKVEQMSKSLSSILEPVIIIIVGGFVGLILIAMYLPMFRLSSVMG